MSKQQQQQQHEQAEKKEKKDREEERQQAAAALPVLLPASRLDAVLWPVSTLLRLSFFFFFVSGTGNSDVGDCSLANLTGLRNLPTPVSLAPSPIWLSAGDVVSWGTCEITLVSVTSG